MIKLITDSSCDLSDEEIRDLGVEIVPLTIVMDGKEYIDRFELHGTDFYNKLRKCGSVSTSQPNFMKFADAFEKCDEDDDIICITLSKHVSGSYNSAVLAKTEMENMNLKRHIHVFDGLSVSSGTAYIVRKAHELAAELKGDVAAILDSLTKIRDNLGTYFFCDTLEFLKKGGRVGTVTASIGSLLGIKPILAVIDGQGRNYAKLRGETAVVNWMVERFANFHVDGELEIVHADNLPVAEKIIAGIKALGLKITPKINIVGSVIGAHSGPSSVGMTFLQAAPTPWPMKPSIVDKVKERAEQVTEKVKERIIKK